MNRTTILLAFLLLNSLSLKSQMDSLTVEDVQKLIASMSEKDQEMRRIFGLADRTDSVNYEEQQATISQMDEMHNIMLHKVIENQGYPAASDFGMVTTHKFWILIMHQDSDLELQESVLEWMKSVLFEGEVIGRDLAYLQDRVAVNKGECQVYGTQFRYDKAQNKNVPFEICDVKKLKKLRKKLGLMPFATQEAQENRS
jgi:hypothetical protein